MIAKEYIKNKIDQMPDELVEKVYAFIDGIKKTKMIKRSIHTYRLNGAFDQMDIRKMAYE